MTVITDGEIEVWKLLIEWLRDTAVLDEIQGRIGAGWTFGEIYRRLDRMADSNNSTGLFVWLVCFSCRS